MNSKNSTRNMKGQMMKTEEQLRKCVESAYDTISRIEKQSCEALENVNINEKGVDLFDVVYKINQEAHESKKKIETYCF